MQSYKKNKKKIFNDDFFMQFFVTTETGSNDLPVLTNHYYHLIMPLFVCFITCVYVCEKIIKFVL